MYISQSTLVSNEDVCSICTRSTSGQVHTSTQKVDLWLPFCLEIIKADPVCDLQYISDLIRYFTSGISFNEGYKSTSPSKLVSTIDVVEILATRLEYEITDEWVWRNLLTHQSELR